MNIKAGLPKNSSSRARLLGRASGDAFVLIAAFVMIIAALGYFGLLTNVHGGLSVLSPLLSDTLLGQLSTVMLVASFLGLIFVARRFSDIRKQLILQHQQEAQARSEARRDPLTGLSNRRHLNEALIEEIEVADSGEATFALMLLDLDRFKPVNDVFGHEAGDLVLKQVGERISKASVDARCIARTGGDEFAILLSHKTGRSNIEFVADKILRYFESPFEVEGKPVRICASIGISFYPAAGDDAEALFRHADVALYNAKRNGRNRYCLYAEEMDSGVREMSDLALDIRRGLRENEFIPYFQPLVDLRSGKAVGMEVLARWQHPVHGLVAPDRFIPVAEALDLVGEVTFQAMRKACKAANEWSPEMFLAVNISPGQLRDQWLPERILAVLTETGFSPTRLEVEITENSLVEDIDVARAILYSLKNQGMRIALDDFGTGYSSLVHLRDLPLDKIKIDRSFVTSLKTDIGSAKIVSAILGLVTSLGLPTVAEGIESEDVAKILTDLGCAYGQGYLYSPPLSAEAVDDLFMREDEARGRRAQLASVASA